MKKALTLALVAAMAGGSVSLQAYEEGDFILRLGATTVDPDASSDKIRLPGDIVLEADVDDDTQLGIIPVYMFRDNWGLEVLAATPFKHDISVSGSGLSLDAGDTKHLPPTVSVQWYPRGGSSGWQPYLGLGVNWTTFFSTNISGELEGALNAVLGAERAKLELDDSFGIAVQAGIDIPLGEHWALNAGIWWIDIDTEAEIKTDVGNVKFDVEIDPWVYNFGIAYKF
jgi:outer membrane protein